MFSVVLNQPDSIDEFRNVVRPLIAANALPDSVAWHVGETGDLFDQMSGHVSPAHDAQPVSIPSAYLPLAEDVICHRDPERFALLYRLLWRIRQGERALMMVETDPLVHRLRQMQKSVARDHHKMTAFLRFRRVQDDLIGENGSGDRYVAWFEPEHHILRHVSSFFVDRFAAMRWSILTPERSMHWEGQELRFGPAVSKSEAPRSDDIEDWWKRYYRATFNPARVNPDAMRGHMPKKYWHNMPETAIIPDLLAGAGKRTQAMIDATRANRVPHTPGRPRPRPRLPPAHSMR